MPNANRPKGFEPHGPIRQTTKLICGSTVATNEFVSLASDGYIDPAIAGADILGLALQPGDEGQSILVSVDPEQLYVGQADGSDIDADSDVGKCCDILDTAASSVYKNSRQQIDSSTISADEGQLFIVQVVPRINNFSGTNAEVVVKINEHQAFGDAIEVAPSSSLETAELILNTGNGIGGGAGNLIRRYTTVERDTGSGDFYTYADSATDGMSVTILRSCLVNISFSDSRADTSIAHGVSVNAPDLTVAINALAAVNRIIYANSAAGGFWVQGSGEYTAALNDVIRSHCFITVANATDDKVRFAMSFIGLD